MLVRDEPAPDARRNTIRQTVDRTRCGSRAVVAAVHETLASRPRDEARCPTSSGDRDHDSQRCSYLNSAPRDIAIALIAALIGAAASQLWSYVQHKVREKSLNRSVRAFFGPPGKILVVHSAVFDAPEQAYNYPATDTRAARALAKLFESVGLREGPDFAILPDRSVRIDDALWANNLVLLCGPARNKVFEHVAPLCAAARYSMTVTQDRRNVLTDNKRRQQLRSSREVGAEDPNSGFDFGLISSLPSPQGAAKRVVLLAGIHGTGTVGAAEFVCSLTNLRELVNRQALQAPLSHAVRVDYDEADRETPIRMELV